MIYETIQSAERNPQIAKSALIQEALAWASKVRPGHELGRFDLRGDDLYAMVQERESKPREERKEPETHRVYVDLQYCVDGGEFIDWYANIGLKPTTEYDAEKDFQLFQRPEVPPVPLLMRPGYFALLYPDDAHVPVVSDGEHGKTWMVVFKIRLAALQAEAR